jgi:hypothetical protein
MALLKFGSIITDSRGSLGGTTIKWGPYGHTAGNKGQSAKKSTRKQSTIRATFALLSKRWWSTLDASQRDGWRALAAATPLPNRWGDTFPLTGLAFYLRVNQRLLQVGTGILDDAPANQTVTALTAATLSVTAPSTASLTFTPSPVPADHALVLRTTGLLSPGIVNPAGRYLYCSTYAASATSPQSVYSPLSLLTGTLHTGRQIFATAHLLSLDTGAESTPIAIATIVS